MKNNRGVRRRTPITWTAMRASTGRIIRSDIFCAFLGSLTLEEMITPSKKLSMVTAGTRRKTDINQEGVTTVPKI